MNLISINVGTPQMIGNTRSGIVKLPALGPVQVGALGLAGDAIIHKNVHGGLEQAVYIYGQPDYDFWAAELGRPLEPGLFGENLTLSDFESATALVGDRLQIGDVLLEITSPRIPCNTFATRMGDPKFVKTFLRAGRPGAYARVLAEGTLTAGQSVAYSRFAGEPVTLRDFALDFENPGRDTAIRWLKAPINSRIADKYRQKHSL